MTPSEAGKAIGSIADACRVIAPDNAAYHLALGLMQKYRIDGDKIFDVYLAATATMNGIQTIATDNTKDFSVIEEIDTINPFK